ncbi:MAG: cysteine hydrolase family protein [Candidatus Micrarchaeia archaeon]
MKVAFFDVDTQEDFINPRGALYVKGSERLEGNFRRLVVFARQHGIPLFGSVDTHYGDEAHRQKEQNELKRWGGPFPDHCIKGTPGHQKIAATKPHNPIYVADTEPLEEERVRALRRSTEVYFEKIVYSCFDNPYARPVLEAFDEFVVFGVATDYCVKATALGLREMGKKVIVVSDAIAPVDEAGGEKAIAEMTKAGVEFKKTDEVIEELTRRLRAMPARAPRRTRRQRKRVRARR